MARRTHQIEAWVSGRRINAGRYQIYSADVSMPNSIVAAGQTCMMQHGIPDVVITRTFAANNIGSAATFHPFLDAMVKRVIPWQMGVAAKVLRLLPNWLFDKAFVGVTPKTTQSGCLTGSPVGHFENWVTMK